MNGTDYDRGQMPRPDFPKSLPEFVFRFNRRNTPMAAFQTVLGIGTHVAGPTYEGIYEGTWTHKNPPRQP